jgi:hypothetical protein
MSINRPRNHFFVSYRITARRSDPELTPRGTSLTMAGQGHSLPANGELPRPLTPGFYGGEKRPARRLCFTVPTSERIWSRKVPG